MTLPVPPRHGLFACPKGGVGVGLREAVDTLAGSEPFERLLLARDRPIVARAAAAEDLVVAAVASSLETAVLAVAPGPRESEALAADLEAFLGPESVALLPAWEALPYEGLSPAPDVAARRAQAAHRLRGATGAFVIVAPAMAAQQRLIPTLGDVEPLVLTTGEETPPDVVGERLVDLGYRRSDVVEHRGEFAVRGGVVDVFPGTARRPVRLDYVGDDIESIREFVPATQLTSGALNRVLVPPVRELVPDDELRARAGAGIHDLPERLADGLSRIAEGLHRRARRPSRRSCSTGCRPWPSCCPTAAWIVLTEAERTLDRARAAHEEARALAEAIGWPGPEALVLLGRGAAGRT